MTDLLAVSRFECILFYCYHSFHFIPIHNIFFVKTIGHVDREMWNRFGEQGYLGVCIPAEDGGIGGTFKDEVIVMEEQIYANCHAPAMGVKNFGL